MPTLVIVLVMAAAGLALSIALVMWVSARERRKMEKFRADFGGYKAPVLLPEERKRCHDIDRQVRLEKKGRAHQKGLTVAFDQRRSLASSVQKLARGVERAREGARRFQATLQRIRAVQKAVSKADDRLLEGDYTYLVRAHEDPSSDLPTSVLHGRHDWDCDPTAGCYRLRGHPDIFVTQEALQSARRRGPSAVCELFERTAENYETIRRFRGT